MRFSPIAPGRLSQEYTSRNAPVTDAESRPEPLKLWFTIIGILIAWLSFPGAFQFLPLHLRKIPFAFALVLAIVVAPFVGNMKPMTVTGEKGALHQTAVLCPCLAIACCCHSFVKR